MKLTTTGNRGRSLETVIDASQRNVVCITKIPSGAKWIGPRKMVATKSPVDFMGVVCGTGRAIVFDAKTCNLARSFPVSNADHFPEHQREFLIRHGRAGAIAGLLVESTRMGAYFWVNYHWLIVTSVGSYQWGDDVFDCLGPNSGPVLFECIPGVGMAKRV